MESFEQKAINEFERYRGLFIEEILASVIQEHQNNTSYDYVNVAVANKGKVNTCSQCVCTYDKHASVCHSCKLDANSFPHNCDPYHRTEAKHLQGKPSVYIGNSTMVNPNFIEAVKTILEHVSATGQLSENHDSRKWTFVVSDDVPYVYASAIQDSVQCTVCEEYIDSSNKDNHVALHESDHISFSKPFENLILI